MSFSYRVIGVVVALGLILVGCGGGVRLVVRMGRPMAETVAASEGYGPAYLDERRGESTSGPRGTSFVSARELRVKVDGVSVFQTSEPTDVAVDTTGDLVDSVRVLPSQRRPLAEAARLVEAVRSELRSQGWREFPACASGLNDPEVWTRCTEPMKIGGPPQSVMMALEHGPHAFLSVEVRCVQRRGEERWSVSPRYRFSTEPTCINSGPSE